MANETVTDPDYTWLTWGVSAVLKGGLSQAVLDRSDADRAHAACLNEVTRTIPLRWTEDRTLGARFIGVPQRLRDDWRRWAELAFNGERIVVEAFGGNGWSPGFGFTDVRIYRRGALAGRAWSVGCSLGFGGHTGPAAAVLRRGVALRVDDKLASIELVRRAAS